MTKSESAARESTIKACFASDPYTSMLGFELGSITEGEVSVATTVRADQANFHGSTHGGLVFSLADCAFSLAGNAYSEAAVAIDTHMVYTAPSKVGDRLVATAQEVTRGRTLGTYRVTVSRVGGRTVGLFTGTVLVLD